jgi:Flp pilus assembly pilin Flp
MGARGSHRLWQFVRSDDGQDLIEYALLVAFISLACILGMQQLGMAINNSYNSLSNSIAPWLRGTLADDNSCLHRSSGSSRNRQTSPRVLSRVRVDLHDGAPAGSLLTVPATSHQPNRTIKGEIPGVPRTGSRSTRTMRPFE